MKIFRASLIKATILCMAFFCLEQSVVPQVAQARSYSDQISESYNFRFGTEMPFVPGNAAWQGDGFIKPGAFPNATYCAHCHQEAYHQWRQALHSNAFRAPFYRASVNILIRTKGIEFSRHCDSCHNPIGVLSGALTQNSLIDRKFDEDGLTCMVCHSIQGLKSTAGNGGYIMGVPAVMTDAQGNRIPGEVPYDEIMKHTDRHVHAVMQSFYRTPQFCAACHKANLPEHLNDFKFLSAFSAFDEWQQSKFSQQNPLTFYTGDFTTCQNCHMKRAPNTLPDYGAKNGTFASHSWAAGNTAVPFYYGFDEQMEKTVRFLRAGNYLNIDIFGLKRENESAPVGPLGTIPIHLEPGTMLDAYVVVQNKNIGHSLIPEVRDLYQAWLEFQVKDSSGKDIYHSGFLKPDGVLDEQAHSFTNRPVNDEGGFVDNHKVWTIRAVAYDNTVQAGRSTLVRYRFRLPVDITGPVTLTANINYRHLRTSYLDNVLGSDHPSYPIVQLATRMRTLKIGDNPRGAPDTDENPEWMRWNNLGIAYLDQLQYQEAVEAFQKVVNLRPDYVDGYTNVALTEMQWEKYASAWSNISRSLALKPKNARALYYAALIERRTGHNKEEMRDLEEVVRQFPQSRDARRELGLTFYREGQYDQARTQFEALQGIDPDDLAAHYNLAILYRRMGMPKEADQQQALFRTEKINSTARTFSWEFLQQHPEISMESIPWHIHGADSAAHASDIPPAPATTSSAAYGGGHR